MHWTQGIAVNKIGVLSTPKKCMAWLGRWSSGGREEKTALHSRLKPRTPGCVAISHAWLSGTTLLSNVLFHSHTACFRLGAKNIGPSTSGAP